MFRPKSPVPSIITQPSLPEWPPSDWPDRTKRPAYAWLASIALHTAVLVLVGLAANRVQSGLDDSHDGLRDATASKNGVDEEREISVSLIHRVNDRDAATEIAGNEATTTTQSGNESASQIADTSGGRGENAQDSTAAASSVRTIPPGFTPPIDLDGVLADLMAAPEPGANSALNAGGGVGRGGLGDLGSETGSGRNAKAGDRGLQAAGGGASSAASLFGVTGIGNRIVYVIDRSDSMNGSGGRPLTAAKSELINSLDALKESQFFQFILYNDEPRPYRGANSAGNTVQMIQAEKPAIKRAQSYIESVDAFGGTHHADALRIALRMRPDVIFFLTDGRVPGLTNQELSDIRRLADSYGTTIHGIEFGTDPEPHPASFMPLLASATGGQYRYFDVSSFSSSGEWLLNPNP